jgi:hypothetical protein
MKIRPTIVLTYSDVEGIHKYMTAALSAAMTEKDKIDFIEKSKDVLRANIERIAQAAVDAAQGRI